jgi:hypothetical protein
MRHQAPLCSWRHGAGEGLAALRSGSALVSSPDHDGVLDVRLTRR